MVDERIQEDLSRGIGTVGLSLRYFFPSVEGGAGPRSRVRARGRYRVRRTGGPTVDQGHSERRSVPGRSFSSRTTGLPLPPVVVDRTPKGD